MEINVMELGAIPNGIYSNTKIFEEAFDKCDQNGGGTIYVPKGIYLTGPMYFKNNVTLYLERGAIILFDKNIEEYKIIKTNFEGIDRLRATSPIMAINVENIAIKGDGIIDGNGHLWRYVKEFKQTQKQWDELLKISPYVIETDEKRIWFPSETSYLGSMRKEERVDDPDGIIKAQPYYDYYRPSMVFIRECKNVLLEGVTFENSPMWNVHILFSENIVVNNVKIKNPYWAQSGDGIDIESSNNVCVKNSYFEVGDDAICLKSGKGIDALKYKESCHDILICDNVVYQAHGGFVIGSETARGIHDVRVINNTFINTDIGLRFKSAIGRCGEICNVVIDGVNMIDIKNEAVLFTTAYQLYNLKNEDIDVNKTANLLEFPEFYNFKISNINCTNSKVGIKILGTKEKPVHDIYFENINIKSERDFELKNCYNIYIDGKEKDVF